MSMTITSVPESLTRRQYVDLIASVGFVPHDVRCLTLAAHGIRAEVFVRGEDGQKKLAVPASYERPFETHTVFVPILDEESVEELFEARVAACPGCAARDEHDKESGR